MRNKNIMDYKDEELRVIFKHGRCYHCMRALWFSHFGKRESSYGWYVEKVFNYMTGDLDLHHSHASCYACSRQKRGPTHERDRRISSIHAAWFPH